MKKIGKGSYGEVVTDGEVAIKKFQSLTDLIRESFCAVYFSRDCPDTVQIHGCDFDKLTLTMDLWSCSLQSILDKKLLQSKDLTLASKHAIFSSILKGIANIHNKCLVHADIKPGNILCNKELTKAVISDYGLSSINFSAKISCTSPAYKPLKASHNHRSYDMFAICLIGLEIFTSFYVTKRYTKSELRSVVRRYHLEDRLKSCLLEMLTENPRECILAEDAHERLYNTTVSFPKLSAVSVHLPDSKVKKYIKEETINFFATHSIRRPERCYKCILLICGSLFGESDLSNERIVRYTYVMFYVFSIVFGKKVPLAIIQKNINVKGTKEISLTLATILENSYVLKMMYAP